MSAGASLIAPPPVQTAMLGPEGGKVSLPWARWFHSIETLSNIVATGQPLTRVDDTNVTLTLSAGAPQALVTATSITVGWSGVLAVTRGGIGVGTLEANGVLYGNGVGAVQALAVNATATNKYLRQVSSGAPSWSTIPASEIVSPFALTRVDDTNVTLTLGGSPAVSLLAAVSLTLGWTGQLAIARGGTNTNIQTANGVTYYDGSKITSGTIVTFDGSKVFTVTNTAVNDVTVRISGTSSAGEPAALLQMVNSTTGTTWNIENGRTASLLTFYSGGVRASWDTAGVYYAGSNVVLINNAFLKGIDTGATERNLIGLNTTNVVRIASDGNNVSTGSGTFTFGSTAIVGNANSFAGTTTGNVVKSLITVSGADIVAIDADGLGSRFFGNVGIGRTPTTIFDVTASTNAVITAFIENTNTGTASSARFYAKAGTTGVRLATFSQGYTTGSFDVQSGSALFTSDTSPGGLSIAAVDAVGVIRFYTGGTAERARFDATGNLGIGTTTPGYPLTVTRTGGADYAAYFTNSAAAGSSYGLNIDAGGNSSDWPLQLRDRAGTLIMRVVGDGNVGIGTGTPNISGGSTNHTLTILGPTTGRGRLELGSTTSNTSANATIGELVGWNAANSNWLMRINLDSGGNADSGLWVWYTRATGGSLASTLILQADATVTMPVYGAGVATFDASGNITSVSDERLKRGIRPWARGLAFVSAIETVDFFYGRKTGLDQQYRYVGFRAQQIRTLAPELVFSNRTGQLSVWERGITAGLVNAVKELKARVEALEAVVVP